MAHNHPSGFTARVPECQIHCRLRTGRQPAETRRLEAALSNEWGYHWPMIGAIRIITQAGNNGGTILIEPVTRNF
jgi:hypothetical protein